MGPSEFFDINDSNHYDYSFKVMLVGDSYVGKTCILLRFRDGAFVNPSGATVGIDYGNKTFHLDSNRIKIQIWDTAGQERFRSLTHAYYRDADAIVLVYDIESRYSYNNIKKWLRDAQEKARDNVTIIVLGNKCDSEHRRVLFEEGEQLAAENDIIFYETSAVDGQNIDEAFERISRELIEKEKKYIESMDIEEMNEPKRKKEANLVDRIITIKGKCCC